VSSVRLAYIVEDNVSQLLLGSELIVAGFIGNLVQEFDQNVFPRLVLTRLKEDRGTRVRVMMVLLAKQVVRSWIKEINSTSAIPTFTDLNGRIMLALAYQIQALVHKVACADLLGDPELLSSQINSDTCSQVLGIPVEDKHGISIRCMKISVKNAIKMTNLCILEHFIGFITASVKFPYKSHSNFSCETTS
jgi:hypothetical protein